MTLMDDFWKLVESQIKELHAARTVDDVLRICPAVPGVTSGQGFFAGGGGDEQVCYALQAAGWTWVWSEADYFWCMKAPDDGDLLTYIEGDMYRGNQKPLPHGMPDGDDQ